MNEFLLISDLYSRDILTTAKAMMPGLLHEVAASNHNIIVLAILYKYSPLTCREIMSQG